MTPDASNGVAGDDQRILIAQLTTDGDLSGQFRTQIFPEGDQDNDVRADMSFEHERDCSDLPVVLVEEVTNFVDDWNYTLDAHSRRPTIVATAPPRPKSLWSRTPLHLSCGPQRITR